MSVSLTELTLLVLLVMFTQQHFHSVNHAANEHMLNMRTIYTMRVSLSVSRTAHELFISVLAIYT